MLFHKARLSYFITYIFTNTNFMALLPFTIRRMCYAVSYKALVCLTHMCLKCGHHVLRKGTNETSSVLLSFQQNLYDIFLPVIKEGLDMFLCEVHTTERWNLTISTCQLQSCVYGQMLQLQRWELLAHHAGNNSPSVSVAFSTLRVWQCKPIVSFFITYMLKLL